MICATCLPRPRRRVPAIASPGADVGLCIAEESQIGPEMLSWGARAKTEVLTLDGAHAVAAEAGIHIAGLTGDHGGVIGALAAVGLRRSGADGRFLELGDLRKAVGEQPAMVFIAAGVERFVLGELVVELEPDELRADDVLHFAVWIGPAPAV